MSERGKKYKNQTARENRQIDKVAASGKDESARIGKKRGKKNCGGWIGRWGCGEKTSKESLSCSTCHRKFHDTACHDSHKEYCEIKASKDKEALVSWARRIYDKYVDVAGVAKKEMLLQDERGWSGVYGSLKWDHKELVEAHDILKKRDEDYFRGDCDDKRGWGGVYWPSRAHKCVKCGNIADLESVPMNGVTYSCRSEKCKNRLHSKTRMGDNSDHALELWNKENPSDN